MTVTIKHATITGAAANPEVLVDGPSWDASHTITGTLDAAQMPAFTGDISSSAGAVATTLATVNSNIGTFGSATQSVQFTANGKGLLTAAANVTITPAIGSVTGLGTGVSTFLATPSSANLRAALTDEVGTGAAYFVGGALGTPASGTLTSCTGLPLSTGISGSGTGVLTALAVNVGTAGSVLVNGGALGTPSSGTLTNCTGLPVTTGISGTGANIPAFLATPSSANLRSALTDETGTGVAVFATTPTITTPNIIGVSDGSSAAAGSVSESFQQDLLAGSAATMVNGSITNVASKSVSAGRWLIWGTVIYSAQATTAYSETHASTSLTSAAVESLNSNAAHVTYGTGQAAIVPTPPRFLNISTPTTVYLTAACTVTAGSAMLVYGSLFGIRLP